VKRAAIVGVGQTRYEACKDQNYEEMVHEAVSLSLKDAEMTMDQIDNIVSASQDFWDGRTVSSMAIADATGEFMKSSSKVAGDGLLAALYGWMRILSGSYGTTLVVAHCKESDGPQNLIANAIFDPIYHRPLGLDIISTSALQARAYMDAYGITEGEMAMVSVKNHHNGTMNPYAQEQMEITVEDVLSSEPLADPIKRLDASPVSDGACALILASEERIVKGRHDPVWILGAGHCMEGFGLGERDLVLCESLEKAAQKAYEMAGIRDPKREIQVVELSENYSYQELLFSEAMGLCDRGQGGRMIREGITSMDGDLPINPSGGMLCGNPVIVAGLTRLAEATIQVRGQGGKRQIKGVRRALAHGHGGPCGQSHCVMIVGI